MAEDTLVQMLLEVADGNVVDDRDIDLARAAARWAHEYGKWLPYLNNSFIFQRNGMHFWVVAKRSEQVLEVRASAGRRHRWTVHARHRIAHLGHGLNVLVTEELLPERYSPIGRRALEDHAEVLWRAAKRTSTAGAEMTDWACGLAEAASSAERFAVSRGGRGPVAVSV
jgi:hypothetical protein